MPLPREHFPSILQFSIHPSYILKLYLVLFFMVLIIIAIKYFFFHVLLAPRRQWLYLFYPQLYPSNYRVGKGFDISRHLIHIFWKKENKPNPRTKASNSESRDFSPVLPCVFGEPSLYFYYFFFSFTFTNLNFYYPNKTLLTLLSLIFSSVALKIWKWLCPEGWSSQWRELRLLLLRH